MRLFQRTSVVPPEVARAVTSGERLLAHGVDEVTGRHVVCGAHRLYVVSPGPSPEVVLGRPWRMVDAGTWDPAAGTLRVTWVDGATPERWRLSDDTTVPQVLRERVQASVVVVEAVDLGEGRTARVVVRKDLADGALSTQTVLGPGVRYSDPGVLDATRAVVARLREQVGLD